MNYASSKQDYIMRIYLWLQLVIVKFHVYLLNFELFQLLESMKSTYQISPTYVYSNKDSKEKSEFKNNGNKDFFKINFLTIIGAICFPNGIGFKYKWRWKNIWNEREKKCFVKKCYESFKIFKLNFKFTFHQTNSEPKQRIGDEYGRDASCVIHHKPCNCIWNRYDHHCTLSA